MDITQIRTLIQVAETGSLSKAADRLCIAQPALSRHVRMLEEELGTRLFERHGRGMVLTEQGQIALRHAQRIVAEIDEMRISVADESESLRGHIAIGLTPTVSDILAVPLFDTIREACPYATVRIVNSYSLYLMDWALQGKIDVLVLYDPLGIRSLRAEPLVEEDLYAVAPPEAGLQPDMPLNVRDLRDAPLALPGRDHSLRILVENAAKACRSTLNVVVEADSLSIVRDLVREGRCWTILPLAAVQDDLAAGRVSVAPLASPVIKRKLELCFPSDRPVSQLADFAGRSIASISRKLVREGRWPGRIVT
ncbi:LysR family transcriptional regulator [Pseudogemmobacter humi]|uniref:HTH-type transcriptional regulator CynR n=1 Tax=Pseudogemmobacter humi TaxID=2483812 RepID=A0A3P5X284_9RHOB|nr:LysR family transcriptional regulator [Pseudogemmobacter humi]VDC22347.1 HTH-type transcriptional regulator CynR [Pseudogemmobacter humi]